MLTADRRVPGADLPAPARLHGWRRFSRQWPARAQACTHALADDATFQPERPDFIETLLPFAGHPRYCAADDATRARVLTHAWLIYNRKQIELERCVVMPACLDLLRDRLPGAAAAEAKQVVAEALTDESYHILMIEHASELARRQRGLDVVPMAHCHAVDAMQRDQALHAEPWQRSLVQFAAAVVSEVFICSHLRQLAGSRAIQPLHAAVTRAHLQDELSHGSIFRSLLRAAYGALDARQREFLVGALGRAVAWFSAPDMAPWVSVLAHVDLPGRRELLGDGARCQGTTADFSTLLRLFDELGIRDACQRVAHLATRPQPDR